MTQQLLEARTAVKPRGAEVQAARTNLQTILDNLTAGVLVLDAQWRVVIANPGAAHILRSDVAALSGQTWPACPRWAAWPPWWMPSLLSFLKHAAQVW